MESEIRTWEARALHYNLCSQDLPKGKWGRKEFPPISFSEAESSDPGVRRSLLCGQPAFDRDAKNLAETAVTKMQKAHVSAVSPWRELVFALPHH